MNINDVLRTIVKCHPVTKKAGTKYQFRYFGNPAVCMRPLRLSAPSSRMV